MYGIYMLRFFKRMQERNSSNNCHSYKFLNHYKKKILAPGDSYIIGQSVTEAERFPNQIISLFKASGINLKYPSQIIAKTGWTMQSRLTELQFPETYYIQLTILLLY